MARPKKDVRKSEVLTIRLDPRLRYLTELAARKQRRPISSFIEWAIEQSLGQVLLREEGSGGWDAAMNVRDADRLHQLWDVDEAERLVKLAFHFPELLTHEEQVVWKLVRECGLLWRGSYSGVDNYWTWKVDEKGLILDRLKQHWESFTKVAREDAPISSLPTWAKVKPSKSTDMDDDIPF